MDGALAFVLRCFLQRTELAHLANVATPNLGCHSTTRNYPFYILRTVVVQCYGEWACSLLGARSGPVKNGTSTRRFKFCGWWRAAVTHHSQYEYIVVKAGSARILGRQSRSHFSCTTTTKAVFCNKRIRKWQPTCMVPSAAGTTPG